MTSLWFRNRTDGAAATTIAITHAVETAADAEVCGIAEIALVGCSSPIVAIRAGSVEAVPKAVARNRKKYAVVVFLARHLVAHDRAA